MVSAKQLHELQETDTVAAEKDTELKEVRARLADGKPIAAATQKASQLDAQAEAQSKSRNSAQVAVRQMQDKMKEIDGKLYGGGITNTRELTAFEEERQFLQTQLGEEEDRLLELMVVVDDLQESRDEAVKALKGLEARREIEVPQLQHSQAALEKELAQLSADRKQLTPKIPPQYLATYESLRRTRGGRAVARLDKARGICLACRIALPAKDLQRAKASREIVQCNSCHRILYVE